MKHLIQDNDEVRNWLIDQIGEVEAAPECVIGVVGDDGIESAVGYYNLKPGATVMMAWAGKMTRRFVHTIWHIAFVQLGVKTVIGTVVSDNEKCLKLARQMGCREVGTIIRGYDGERDYVVFQMLPEECKWLGGRYAR